MNYQEFIKAKSQDNCGSGFSPLWIPDFLFDFQRSLVEWAIERGRCAIFADCGLGKTPMQLVWAENIVRKTNRPVLILTPLAVSAQTVREAVKFSIPAHRSYAGEIFPGINVTNYQRLHHYKPSDFAGCVCDESSILKSFDGSTRKQITAFIRQMPYRLLCTATAAPNDYIELGTSSEALGYLDYGGMLKRFFREEANLSQADRQRRLSKGGELVLPKWVFKAHAEEPFWKWVCSWARAVRRPSDLGCEDGEFVLPALNEHEHHVAARSLPPGKLFHVAAVSFRQQLEERRRTIPERCERIVELVSHDRPALVWCHLNLEGDELEKAIPGATQVCGSESDEAKEEKLLAFADREIRVLVTKPKIGAWGMNYQHCAHMTFFPSHSFEQYYQGVRRCWRFGQKHPVTVDLVSTEAEQNVMQNLQRKQRAAERMFERLVARMNEQLHLENDRDYPLPVEVPVWL